MKRIISQSCSILILVNYVIIYGDGDLLIKFARVKSLFSLLLVLDLYFVFKSWKNKILTATPLTAFLFVYNFSWSCER